MKVLGFDRLGLSISVLFILASALYIPIWMDEDPAQQSDQGPDALKPAYKAKNLTTTLYLSLIHI